MDDDLPKEGELLDISQNRKTPEKQKPTIISSTKETTRLLIGVIGVLIVLAGLAFFANSSFGGHADPEKIAIYKDSTLSVVATMKSQLPYLENVGCEGSNPDKDDCVHFVGRFRPIKDSAIYLSSMGIIDKAPGVSDADIELIKGHIKVLAEAKRTTLASREQLTFLIDSMTEPKVGAPFAVKIKCTESGVDIVMCETIR